ncbi:SLOG family protein [Hymenobacter sp. UV11]|uniref:SLOG family protein n=1 Tax=Hymenobacter sp. UV11 TaxID=1849735 RepID=UPI001F1088C6|nr:SLOG family protein [Hymenobacter sp. UV11]
MQKETACAGSARGLVVAVVGSRSVTSCKALGRRLDALHALGKVAQVVSGGAAGVDTLATQWAMRNLVPLVELLPDYRAHGKAATHLRNAEIVKRADLVLLVWDGESHGTLSSARAAAKLGRHCEWLGVAAPSAVPVAGGLGL